MISYLKKKKREIHDHLININGWETNRKLIIIESDDWGSIRMPSRKVYEDLLKSGDRVDEDPFTRYDSLESETDISELASVLTKFKDCNGKSPIFTANFAVANPDFDKIKENQFQTYYYEPFTRTLESYPQHKQTLSLIKQCAEQGMFFPQLHCREHLNVSRWMGDLRTKKSDVRYAFDNRMISTWKSFTKYNRYAYMDSFNYSSDGEILDLEDILREGGILFRDLFGYASKSFIASCYIWASELENTLYDIDIEYIQGDRYQLTPKAGAGNADLVRKKHYVGQANRNNQIYLIRNCTFEPSWDNKCDWVDRCLSQISTSFQWHKPATISTHRLNYIGYIDEKNRSYNLKLLERLIAGILKSWPDVEFITTVDLGDMIRRSNYGE